MLEYETEGCQQVLEPPTFGNSPHLKKASDEVTDSARTA